MKNSYYLALLERLLYQHDCVIIPSFGGFLTHYVSAQIHLIDKQIHPPRRRVAFNVKLQQNDGFFINNLARELNLPYKIAAELVENWSKELETQLQTDRKILFPNIGKLYYNQDEKLEFQHEPTNFLLDAYALPILPIAPIQAKPAENASKSNAHRPFAARAAATKKPFSPQSAALSGVLLLLVGLPFVFWLLNPKYTTPDVQTASHLGSVFNITTITEPATPVEIEPDTTTTNTNIIADSNKTLDPAWMHDSTEVAKKVDTKANTYVIVIGAFSDPANAQRVLRRLEKEGYFPDLATTNKGLQRIGIQITCAESELKLHLKDIRKKFNEQAWVIKD